MKTFIDFISESTSKPAYEISFYYDGDDISDYEGFCIVIANSPNEAIKIATKNVSKLSYVDNPYNFRIEKKYSSLEEYKKKYPQSNLDVFK